jgi:hypothetical protein
MQNNFIYQAIINLYNDLYSTCGNTVEHITWKDGHTTTDAEKLSLLNEITRLQIEYDSKEYQRQRAIEYPAIVDQLDKIFHEGIDAWKADIQAVKDKYPKA